jgi:hypothetical protein
MDWLEEELRRALAREEPPEGFERRVRQAVARRGFPARRWLAAAAVVIMAVGAGTGYREYRGRVAKEQVKLAIRMAAVSANHIQNHVRGVIR